eukprot:NODE_131_length_16689_cov_0.437914.p10 type:complete len:197 gc:universal NODE_131_length_16689_cov_0.437914:10144-10734(+)
MYYETFGVQNSISKFSSVQNEHNYSAIQANSNTYYYRQYYQGPANKRIMILKDILNSLELKPAVLLRSLYGFHRYAVELEHFEFVKIIDFFLKLPYLPDNWREITDTGLIDFIMNYKHQKQFNFKIFLLSDTLRSKFENLEDLVYFNLMVYSSNFTRSNPKMTGIIIHPLTWHPESLAINNVIIWYIHVCHLASKH